MTEYTDMVEKAKIQQETEEWAKGIKYIHANNGVIETKFNNGDIQYDRDGRISWHREKSTRETLIGKFHRAVADMTRNYWKV